MNTETSNAIEVELNRRTLQDLGYSISIKKNTNEKKIIKNGQEVTSLCIPDIYIYDGLKYKITKIGENIFSNCIFLQEIKLPDSILEVGERAFGDCESLTKITFPNNLIKIGKYAFSGCESVQKIEFPVSVIEIGENAFSACGHLQTIILPKNLTKINNNIFLFCESLKEITFPNNLKTIGEYAFNGCESLQEVELPDSIIEIGENAFGYCKSLTKIKLPKALTIIDKNVFSECESLQEIELPKNLTKINECAFFECKSLKKIELPDTIKEVHEGAFLGCESLNWDRECIDLREVSNEIKEIKIEEEIIKDKKESVREKTKKEKKTNLNKLIKEEEKKINIFYTIAIIALFLCFLPIFQPINNDTKVFIYFLRFAILAFCIWLIWIIWKPEKKTYVREATLNNYVLQTLGYKRYKDSVNNLTTIYYNEQEVTSLNIPNIYDNNGEKCKITKIGSIFSNCKNLTEVKIPNSITEIDNKAFLNCTNLKNINIPDSVKKIGEESFLGCNSLSPEIRKKILNKIDCEYIKIETNDKINKRVRNCFIFLFVSIIALFSLFFFTKGDNYCGGIGCSIWLIFSVLYCVLYWWPNRCELNNRTLKSLGYKNKFKVSIIEISKTYKIKDQDKHGVKFYTYKIIRIGDNAFKNCKNLKMITIPDSISEIGKNAFSGCTGLTELVIPDSVFEIGENAFKDVENVIYNGNAIGAPWGAKNIKNN